MKLHGDDKMGKIEMVGVDPDFQGRRIGAGLIEFALDWMRDAGMSIAMVETGGDPGHGPGVCRPTANQESWLAVGRSAILDGKAYVL